MKNIKKKVIIVYEDGNELEFSSTMAAFAHEQTIFMLEERGFNPDKELVSTISQKMENYLIWDEGAINYDKLGDIVSEALSNQ